MMGDRQIDQAALFYEFSLDKHVPADHMLRAVDRFVDLDGVRTHLATFYSSTGRPSIDPELLIRKLIVGYCFGIRSKRRLCEEVHLNLAYRWFCRLGLDGDVPDHSTFFQNRHGRFRDSDVLRHVFETVVRRCTTEGLVGGEGFAVDASLIKADANRQSGIHDAEGLDPVRSRRAVREYLGVLDDAAFGAATSVAPKYLAPADPADGCRRSARLPKRPTRTPGQIGVRSNSSTRRPASDPRSRTAGPPNNKCDVAVSCPHSISATRLVCCADQLSPPRKAVTHDHRHPLACRALGAEQLTGTVRILRSASTTKAR